MVAEGQRGFEVAPISPENLREVSALRTLIECYALDLSLRNGDVDWEGTVVAAHHKLSQMEQRMIAGDTSVKETWKRYDWEFHQAMIMACGSRSLMEVHAAIFDKYLRYQMISLTFRGRKAADEHRELLDAALQRDSGTGPEAASPAYPERRRARACQRGAAQVGACLRRHPARRWSAG